MDNFRVLGQKYGTDKVGQHGYHFFYPTFLNDMRNDSFRMLEIGYHLGDSARMWEDYFSNADIFAMDLENEGVSGRHEVIRGDQSILSDLEKVIQRVSSARLIIDDGSHNPLHQYETFEYLFENLLEPGGIYIIEDIELSYWRHDTSLYGYRVGFFNCVEQCKKLADMINSEFSEVRNRLNLSTVTFGQNCIVITKRTEEEMHYFDRSYRFEQRLRTRL